MANNLSNLSEFLSLFLSDKGLVDPDGRPLYEYKISNGKYQALKVLLIEKWEDNLTCYAAFVLYSVEFLRAETSEGHLKWDYIFESIGRAALNTPQIRTQIVEKGLNYWKRDVFKGQNREFLETLRFESGLPNSSLNVNNNLSSLIKYTFQLAESYMLEEEDLIPFIEERIEKYPIPQVLRQENFYRLVTKLCFKFLEFKKRFGLVNQSNPTEYLQSQLTDWKDEMPLKIEGDRMNEFFNGIISDISKTKKAEPLAIIFNTILKEINGVFSITTSANIPKGIYSYESFGIKEDDFNRLPGYFLLYLEIDGDAKLLTGFNKTNNGKISVTGIGNIVFPENIHEKEWKLIFTSENKESRVETELSKFLKLNLNEPLVFVNEESGKWIYRGPAPLKLKESDCRIVINEALYVIQSQTPKLGSTKNGFSVFHVDSDIPIIEQESQSSLWVKLAQENESVKVLDFTQKILPESGTFDFLNENEQISLGFPKVYLLNRLLGLKEFFSGTIEVLNQEKKWEDSSSKVVGRRKFRFKERNGSILGVKTLNLLPPDFKVLINVRLSKIELCSSTNFKLFVLKNGVQTEINQQGNSAQLIIDPSFDDVSKTHIYIGLSFNSFGLIELKIPNPNFSQVFVSGESKVIERVSFSLSKLHGLSIINNNYVGVGERKNYKLKLNDIYNRDASALEIKKAIWVEAFSTNRQPLYQWIQQVNQLFSLTTNTRAKVRISSETPHHYIEVSKYDGELIFDEPSGLFSIENSAGLTELTLSSFRLDQGFNGQDLVTFKLEGTSWPILDYLPSDGVWFVYSEFGSAQSIVPKVIIKGKISAIPEDGPIDHLYQACYLDYDSRIQRFKEFFDTHYLNFDHPVWKELYELFQASEHLPISALDVWKGLVKSPKGMLTFFFSDYFNSNLTRKISEELGFIWQLVSVYRWKESFTTYLEYLNSKDLKFDTNRSKAIKLSEIQNILGLESLAVLLNENPVPINIQLISILMDGHINGQEGSPGIRTRHLEDKKWPLFVGEFISSKFNQLPNELKNLLPTELKNWQMPVVYLPIILAYHSINGRFIRVQELNPEILLGIKLNMDFDKTYFDDVYSLIQGFYFVQNFNNPQQA